jgi:hypothetical protein
MGFIRCLKLSFLALFSFVNHLNMKKNLFNLILLVPVITTSGQNLIPNGSFELYSGCPTYYTQIDCVLFWTNPAVWPGPGGSPDYFNICATPASNVDVPSNIFGYQAPHSGDAYCGIILWDLNNLFREYIQVPLTSTLEPGCYHFEMYVNLANNYKYSAFPIGVYFSNAPITGVPNFLPLPFTPQITITGFTADTLSWQMISGNYIAQGNENYLIIGNYNNDAGTTPMLVNSTAIYDQAYVFIDDVSLTACSPTSVSEQEMNELFTVYPNPVTGHHLRIIAGETLDKDGDFELFDVNGRKVYSFHVSDWNQTIDISGLEQGMYKAVITYGNWRVTKSVAIINK